MKEPITLQKKLSTECFAILKKYMRPKPQIVCCLGVQF